MACYMVAYCMNNLTRGLACTCLYFTFITTLRSKIGIFCRYFTFIATLVGHDDDTLSNRANTVNRQLLIDYHPCRVGLVEVTIIEDLENLKVMLLMPSD